MNKDNYSGLHWAAVVMHTGTRKSSQSEASLFGMTCIMTYIFTIIENNPEVTIDRLKRIFNVLILFSN